MTSKSVAKKVIIFIVEGITDEISLGNIITKLNKNNKIYFHIVNKDLTSDLKSNNTNIIKNIYKQVNDCIQTEHFEKKDIMDIIHIIDIDGAFINEKNIIYKNIPKIEYNEENIITNNPELIKERNERKSNIINKLSATNTINKIPYRIYFFSTNLEHVLHNSQNTLDKDKVELANKFENRFYDSPEKFLTFINDKQYALHDTYENTWKFIKQGNNSLKRYTNFNLFFDSIEIR